jgi:hypothetical protein
MISNKRVVSNKGLVSNKRVVSNKGLVSNKRVVSSKTGFTVSTVLIILIEIF